MTAICTSGGPSSSKPGFNSTVIVSSAAVEGFLVLAGLPEVAAILGPIIAPTVYELTTFCSTDPPSDPGLTGSDIIAATNWLDPLNALAAQEKIRQWFESKYWYEVCQCTSGTTPTAPTLSDPGPVSTNPGLPSGTTGATLCWDYSGSERTPHGTSARALPQFLPNTPSITHSDSRFPGGTVQAHAIPAGANNLFTVLTNTQTDIAQSQGISLFILINGGTGGAQWTIFDGNAIFSDFRQTFTLPANSTHWFMWDTTGSTTIDYVYSMEFGFYCSGQSPLTPDSPCCPPDPILEAKLDQIMGLVTSIYQSLPSPVNSYSTGTAHTGLTGNGTIALSNLASLAVKLHLTTIPNYLGRAIGTPTVLFEAGWLTPVTSEGPIAPTEIQWDTQVVTLPDVCTAVDYSLAAGVVATLTELSEGP